VVSYGVLLGGMTGFSETFSVKRWGRMRDTYLDLCSILGLNKGGDSEREKGGRVFLGLVRVEGGCMWGMLKIRLPLFWEVWVSKKI